MCDISRSPMDAKQLLVGDFWSKAKVTSDTHLKESYV